MTAHELARKLLEQPNISVWLYVKDGDGTVFAIEDQPYIEDDDGVVWIGLKEAHQL